jgi:replicative DNA helicase Mcm
MSDEVKEKPKDTFYEDFLRAYYHEEILTFANEYPDIKTLEINFSDLLKRDGNEAQALLDDPDTNLKRLTQALREYSIPADVELDDAKVAVFNLPDYESISVNNIGSEHISKLIRAEGRITKTAPAKTRIIEAAFQCRRCGEFTRIQQPASELFVEPFECDNDVCGRKGPFVHILSKSIKVDEQRIEIQDLYENVKPSHPVRDIISVVRGRELINKVPAIGAQVVATGIVRAIQKKSTHGLKNSFDLTLEIIHLEAVEPDVDTSLSDLDKKQLRELADRDNIFNLLIDSTAPQILGYREVKIALLAGAVSGPNIRFPSGGSMRGYVHIAIVGDPSTGKTQMVDDVRSKIARSQYAAGKQASVAGLTVAAVKDDLSGTGYTAQAGALVLADKGLMVIDEVDKFDKEDLQSLNTVMERGSFEYHKGGINQTFNARCPIFAVGNPKGLRFDEELNLTEQVDIPIDTVSRFDLVIKIQDIPDPERDKKIADHIDALIGSTTSHEDTVEVPISHEMMCKYLAYAKTFDPIIPHAVMKRTTEYYLELRRMGVKTPVATARDKYGLIRLTKSLAKLRFASECTLEDAKLAILIHRVSLDAIIDPITGMLDGDILFGMSKSQKDRIKIVREAVKGLSEKGSTAHFDEIVAIAKVKGLSKEDVSDILHQLKFSGEAIEVSNECYRLVN